jgi:hypothetical protein
MKTLTFTDAAIEMQPYDADERRLRLEDNFERLADQAIADRRGDVMRDKPWRGHKAGAIEYRTLSGPYTVTRQGIAYAGPPRRLGFKAIRRPYRNKAILEPIGSKA